MVGISITPYSVSRPRFFFHVDRKKIYHAIVSRSQFIVCRFYNLAGPVPFFFKLNQRQMPVLYHFFFEIFFFYLFVHHLLVLYAVTYCQSMCQISLENALDPALTLYWSRFPAEPPGLSGYSRVNQALLPIYWNTPNMLGAAARCTGLKSAAVKAHAWPIK